MIETKHTPGPWEICEHSWGDTSIYVGDEIRKQVCALSIRHLATEETQEVLEAEMDANARLIASAPDMLGALMLASEWWDGEYNHDQTHVKRAIFSAIAKAKGNTQ